MNPPQNAPNSYTGSWRLSNALDGFDALKRVVERIHDKSPMSVDFAYIFNKLYLGKVGLYINDDSLIVVRKDYNCRTQEYILFIWLGYSAQGDALSNYRDDTIALAKSLGCTRIQWQSSRPYQRKMPGIAVKEILYEMEFA